MINNILIFDINKSLDKNNSLLFITEKAIESNIIDEKFKENLFNHFLDRENISSTAFQDGFAIPHARMNEIKEPTIIIVRSKQELNWICEDQSNVQFIISLLIPEKNASNIHMDTLSKIATLLMNEDFREAFHNIDDSNKLLKYIQKKITSKKEDSTTNAGNATSNIKIVGVSACATGVAHTYMAKEALENEGKLLNYKIKIETQGQKGVEYQLSDAEIEEADAVILATDIYVEKDRFAGKKLIQVKTNDAINKPRQVIENSLLVSEDKSMVKKTKAQGANEFNNSKVKTFMGHLLSGVSRMIPFIVFSGILWAIFNSILQTNPWLENNDAFKIAKQISETGFAVFIAMMGGFIAESIAGRAGLAPGFIGTFAAANSSLTFWWNIGGMKGIPQIDSFFGADLGLNNVGLSLFAAIIMGFAAGYLVKWINTWKTPKLLAPIMPIIFIPVVATSVIVFPFIFLLSGPLGYLMNGLVYGISQAGKIQFLNFFIGCLLGAMIGFDMGGPINKIAGTTATALITIDPRLMGAVAAAIPIAPIGCGIATFLGRNLFTDKEKAEGISALGLGFFGISEGAIPFAVNRPKKVLIANLVGSAVAGGLAFLFFVGGYVGMWGGPITALVLGVKAPVSELAKFGTTIPLVFGGGKAGMEFISILWFFLAIIAGSLVHAFIFITLIKVSNGNKINNIFSKFYKNKINKTQSKTFDAMKINKQFNYKN